MSPTIVAVLVSAGVSAFGFGLALLKLWPERNSLITQAAENATQAVSSALESVQQQLADAQVEVKRLHEREQELLLRIESLEKESRERLLQRETELLTRIGELETELQALKAPSEAT